MKTNYLRTFSAAILLVTSGVSIAQEATTKAAPAKPRTVTRLFWQDSDSNSVRWSNLQKGTDWTIKATDINAFPKLDKEQCSLVQMEEAEGLLLTGVHDQEDGTVQSGWVAIDSGVEQEAHGDHFHWKFAADPKIKTSKLDKTQGNPAHVYLYDNQFYLPTTRKMALPLWTLKLSLQASQLIDSFLAVVDTSRWRLWETKFATPLGSIAKGIRWAAWTLCL